MPTRPARGSISRPTLIWIVVAAFLITSGIGVYFAVRKGSNGAAPAGAPINLDAPPAPSVTEGLPQSYDGRAQFSDKDDPNRLAGEMLYKRLDPLPRGRYALEEPQMWVFMKDGRTLHMQATKGNVKFFQGTKDRPESGRFEGGVIARMYAAGVATVASRPDPKVIAPEALVYTESIVFDLSVGEYSTEDVINLSTPDMELQGEGMTIIFNEIRESVAQIELGVVGYLHVRGGGGTKKKETAQKPVAARDPAAPTPSGAAPAPAPPAPKIDLYTINVSGPVALVAGTQTPQSISADRLLAWARLVDGKLPPNAVAELRAKEKQPPPPPSNAAPTEPAVPNPGATAAAPAKPTVATGPGLRERIQKLRILGPSGLEPLTPISDEDALLTWGGKLLVVAVDQAPPELEKEHVAARFVAESAEPVMLMDARSGATVLCSSAHYGATTASTKLDGKDGAPITIADALGGHGELPWLELNLKSGVGQSRGMGYFKRRDPSRKTANGEPDQQHLSWTNQMDVLLATGSTGAGVQSIREAAFTGDVKGIDNKAEISGDYLKALFAPTTTKDSILRSVVVEGNAIGRTLSEEEPQSLRADKFDVSFRLNEKETQSSPSLLLATGNVVGKQIEMVPDEKDKTIRVRRESDLKSESLEAALDRNAKGNTAVTNAVARGNASFNRSDGVSAAGDEIRAAVVDKTVDITGERASVASRGAKLTGPDLHLNQATNAVLVKGPGGIDHTDAEIVAKHAKEPRPAIAADQIGRTTLTWTKGLRFDDSTGKGEVVGDAVAVTHPDPFTQNTVRGAQLTIQTAPAATRAKSEAAKVTKTDAEPLDDLKLLRAEAIAAEKIDQTTPKATAEQRVYVADDAAPGGRRLEKLTYIEGPRLVADEEHGVFSVPAAGRALVMDHSVAKDDEKKNDAVATPFGSAGSQGTTMMEWSGSMTMNRATELADVVGGVRITHKPLSAEKPIILESDEVQARFKLAPKSETPAAVPSDQKQRDQLVSATARGAVRIKTESGNKELTADEATYNAMDGTVEASATQAYSGVTFIDKTKGTPVIARKMRWNLRTDAIEIVEPMTVAPIK